MFGGGKEFAGSSFEIEVRVVARLPSVAEEMTIELVASVTLGMVQDEAGFDFGFPGPARATAASGRSSVGSPGPVTDFFLKEAEDGQKKSRKGMIEVTMQTAHGLSHGLAQ